MDDKNVTAPASGVMLIGITRVAGGCTDNGDSGGPWLAAADGQLQGTNIGGSSVNTCPTPTTYTYFQPISDHIQAYAANSGSLLTTHGANAPTVTGLDCPDSDLIFPPGYWQCRFDYYSSQGVTNVTWSAGTPVGELLVYGTCSSGLPFSVTLSVTNPYGTLNVPSNFTCP